MKWAFIIFLAWYAVMEQVSTAPHISFVALMTGALAVYLTWSVLRGDSKLAAGAAVVFVAGYAVAVIGTWWLSEQKGALDEYFYSPMTLNVIAMAVSAYILLREFGIALSGRERLVRWIHITSVLGLGAYLVHALILDLLARGSFGLILDGSAMHPIVAIPLTALVAFPMSLAVCAGLRRIPGVRLLVP